MAPDVQKTISLMTGAFLSRRGKEVDLIIQYGSLVRGNSHELSDIDIAWVPAREGLWDGITVEVQGVLVDLFPLHWSRLEKWAEFDHVNCTILENLRILHARDGAARERMESLQNRFHALQKPEARAEMLEKSFSLFQRAAYPAYLTARAADRGNVLDCVDAAQKTGECLVHCLMTLNQRGIDSRKEAEILSLPKLPPGFAGLYAGLSGSRDCAEMRRLTGELMEGTRRLLLAEQAEVCVERPDFGKAAGNNNYPEIANGLRHSAREAGLRNAAGLNRELCQTIREIYLNIGRGLSGRRFHDFNTVSEMEHEIPGMDMSGLSGSMAALDWEALERDLGKMEDDMAAVYRKKGTATNSFAGLRDLEEWLKKT